ncbi:unnamed protein product, partial [Iphiclides podalirius]
MVLRGRICHSALANASRSQSNQWLPLDDAQKATAGRKRLIRATRVAPLSVSHVGGRAIGGVEPTQFGRHSGTVISVQNAATTPRYALSRMQCAGLS